MDEQNPTGAQSPLNDPTGIPLESEAPQEEGIPWLKYGMVLFFALAVVNLGLFYFYLSGNKKQEGMEEKIEVKDEEGFSITKPEQTISKEGYSITFSNPRYEYLENQSNFRVDVTLANESFIPSVKIIANCDIAENGFVVKEGEGISVESGENGEIFPGSSSSWTALVILDNANQKVASCLYAPEGVFDPNQTIRVIF
ncbi:hypothetical protein HY502_01150 [Candidatus Woesebacteria bacterium]|nr:hypothetical protein [Candidatus Woesebacteria bacterium]